MNTQTHIGSVCLIAFVLLHFGAAVAPAQSLVSLSGVATDPTQAVLPGVEVTAVNNSTHLRRTAVTNESGWYSFPILLPGSYTVTATRVGFNTRVFPAVELPVKESVSLDLPMDLTARGSSPKSSADDGAASVRFRGMTNGVSVDSRPVGLEGTIAKLATLVRLTGGLDWTCCSSAWATWRSVVEAIPDTSSS